MVLPELTYVLNDAQAIEAVQKTLRWPVVTFGEKQVARPQEGLILVAYKAEAHLSDESYTAYCTTTMRRLEYDAWRVLQHQQTAPLKAS